MAADGSDSSTAMHIGSQAEWAQWLAQHHDKSARVWVRHARKGAPEASVSHPEALEVALCLGWIDALKKSAGDHYWAQRWTPRKPGGIWSKVNRDSALRYIDEGKMQPAGLAAIERARGRTLGRGIRAGQQVRRATGLASGFRRPYRRG